ncbi:YceI family protein [Motiliproteus sp. SC1-56]|uniref:YceI family protein n=1 Tax=Motiliproteus sp. SC1-56 TaxID=2799565 RepID=UPI001A8EE280|nr:YceI family protein [Motiliproteus sp. SC1-56]
MKLKKLVSAASVAAVCASAMVSPAQAEVEHYVLDPAHTETLFFISHLGFSNMPGRFAELEGEFHYDKDNIPASKVTVTVKTGSVDTFHEKRDKHLASPDFFNAAEFPEMTFTSTSIEMTGDKTAKMTGDLTLLGVTKPLTLDVTFNREGLHTFNKKDHVAGFSATGSFKRTDFGMGFGMPGKPGGIGDEVELRIEAEGIRQ